MPGRSHRFHDRFAVRVALLPWERIAVPEEERSLPAAARVDAARARLRSIADDPLVREAIFLASPSLAAELDRWRADPTSARGRRIERGLVRYVARMATRATPFGVLAGVGVGRIAGGRQPTAVRLGERAEHRRRTRASAATLRSIAAALERADHARGLRYRTTASVHRAAGEIRCDRARPRADGAIDHELVAVDDSAAVADALELARVGASARPRTPPDQDPDSPPRTPAGGLRRAELAAALSARGHGDPGELEELVDELIEAQLLRSGLATAPPGDGALPAMIAAAAAAGMAGEAARLGALADRLGEIDAAGVGAPLASYRAALAPVASLLPAGAPPGRRSRFHVEVGARVDAVLARADADAIAGAVDVLVRLTRQPPHRPLQEFRDAFAARWGEDEVPLLVAIDEDAGLGFGTASRAEERSPLLAGLPRAPAGEAPLLAWEDREHWLVDRFARAIASGAREIAIDPAELAEATSTPPARPGDAYGVRARIAAGGDILLDEVHGPSGARLLGRFAVDPALAALVRDHLAGEEALDPDAVHAEIVFAGDGRAGDVLARPALRGAELVHLDPGTAPVQLAVDDLLVSVRGERVVLRSRRLGRRVVPRLTAAHPRGVGVPVHRFLAGVQDQDGALVMWKWGGLLAAPFLPRVRVGRVILARAAWLVGEREVSALRGGLRSDVATFEAMRALAAHLGLPRHVLLVEWQRELHVDLEDPLHAISLAAAIVAGRGARLAEAFPSGDELLARGPEGRHASEVVLLALRDAAAGERPREPAAVSARPRRHPPGSGWLLARLHAGPMALDDVLRGVVAPVVEELLEPAGARWGFRRQVERDPHAALWVRGEPAWLLGEVVPALHGAGAALLAADVLERVQLDTHRREVDRHGGEAAADLIDEIEHLDSRAVLAGLSGDEAADEDARWRLALCGVEGLLAALGLPAPERAALYQALRDERAASRPATTALWRAIGARDRALRDEIDALLTLRAGPVPRGRAALERRDEALRALAPRLRALLGDPRQPRARLVLRDAIDGHVGRSLRGAHATHALVLLDLLRRHHRRAGRRRPG